ncbi:hypothetical protein N8H69_16330 [Achromobacter spanius]|uniref:hypothetical protein n=1 Tax=Achromobacter TaxID=222 RepID=UPI001E5C84F5|nr:MULTISPECIES: hypothetical protein [Achromobacter]MCD0500765.1 hypothetical protein [Achromobacter sp. MY14]MCW3154109.1 hypothetical protein [Achromobacter spanius]
MRCILRNAYTRAMSWLPIGPPGENRACCSRTLSGVRIAGRRIAGRRIAKPQENILTFIRGN